jgi:peptide methionine sulfoxide reductase MsrA
MSEYTETAILAGGCFWPAQELLRHREGVIVTRVPSQRWRLSRYRTVIPARPLRPVS